MKTKFIYLLFPLLLLGTMSCGNSNMKKLAAKTLHDGVMQEAAWAMTQEPVTITAFACDRSAGGLHDFYSEGDYWWPNPEDPEGPYIQRDGETNPQNFVQHREAMIRFSRIVGALSSAYILTGDEAYVAQAFKHIEAWFVNPATLMNPSLLYAQAIKGIVTGRGIGIIDTIHFMEVAQGIVRMQNAGNVDPQVLATTKQWFADYITWLTTHEYGIKEMNAANNHGTCWVMQVASFATLTDNQQVLDFCRERYRTVLLPNQINDEGGFPRELARTKPYGYSLFNLDAMITICQILSTPEDDLWTYTPEGKPSIEKAVAYMAPYIADKKTWPLPPDVMYWDEWPVAHPSMLFSAIRFKNQEWFELWKKYDHFPTVAEVVRNLPIRNPLIWIN